MNQTLHLLSVEDSEEDSELLQLALRRGGYKVTYQVVATPAAMRSALETQKWDVITSDHSMPYFSAPQALALAKELCPDVPFIILSGEIDLNLAVSLMKSGARDYIQKGEMARLIPAIERELKEAESHRERLKVDKALRESHSQIRRILDNLQDAYFQGDLSGMIILASPSAVGMYGYGSIEEMIGLPAINLYANAVDRDLLLAELKRSNRLRDWTTKGLRKDGTTIWVSMNVQFIRDEDGKIIGTEGVVRDITERKQVEEALQTSEANLAEAQQIAHIGSWEWDMRLNTVHWSKEMYRVFDIDPATYDGKPESIIKIVHPDDVEIFTHSMVTNLSSGNSPSLEYRVIHKDGSIHHIFANGRIEFDGSGKPVRSIGTVQDISERKRILEALRESEEKLKKAQHFARVGSWNWNIKTNHLDWSDEMFHIFGLERETFTGSLQDVIAKAIHPDDRDKVEQSNRLVSQDKRPVPLEYRVIWPDQSVHVVWAEAGEFKLDDAGNPAMLSGIAQDVTLRKFTEEQIRQLNAELEKRVADRTAQLTAANHELEAFSYSVSHDLRAPLRALDGFSAALISDYWALFDEQGRHYLTRIRESSHRMGQLIEDLLNLSRVARAEFTRQPVDLSALANSIANELKAQSHQRNIQIDITANMTVQGDENLLRIMLENLLNNAWKFTNRREQTFIQFGSIEQAGEQIYFVRDNGVGFKMEYADRLFGAFQRLHSENEFPGIGIGLAIVQRIVHRHGGRIWCDAEVDRGAAFYFTLGK